MPSLNREIIYKAVQIILLVITDHNLVFSFDFSFIALKNYQILQIEKKDVCIIPCFERFPISPNFIIFQKIILRLPAWEKLIRAPYAFAQCRSSFVTVNLTCFSMLFEVHPCLPCVLSCWRPRNWSSLTLPSESCMIISSLGLVFLRLPSTAG